MVTIKKCNKTRALLSTFIFSLSIILLSLSVPAQADDASWSGTFDDNSQLSTQHVDQDPWKGWFNLTAYNNTSTTWGDFHFLLFDFGGNNSNVIFVDADGGGNDPISSTTTIDSWAITDGGKALDIFFYGDPVAPTETLNLQVWTDNTSNQQNFAVGFYPTVVPEPISSILFVTGGTLLAGRRFWKKRKTT